MIKRIYYSTINDLAGQKFSRLLVIRKNPTIQKQASDSLWDCICDCGKEKTVRMRCLFRGRTKSCGCLRIERCKEENTGQIIVENGIKKKHCYRCKNWKALDDFHKQKGRPNGIVPYCKNCVSVKANNERRKLKLEIISNYGNQCACCGEKRYEFLCIDHINGDGKQHRKSLGSSSKMYTDIKRQGFPKDRFRLLCHNCNMSFGFYGFCPHVLEKERTENLTTGCVI